MSLDDKKPLFSYEAEDYKDGDSQIARRIVVTSSGRPVYDSGRVEDEETFEIEYNGEELCPHTRYEWYVTVWTRLGDLATSEIASFHNGYIGNSFADCKWICADECEDAYTSYKFKKSLSLSQTPSDAIFYVYSPALFDVYVNGELADDRRFTPGAAPAGKGYYETYDLTGKLSKGENTIGIFVGDGYNKISFSRYGWVYEGKKTVVAELRLRFSDGREERILSDGSWLGKRSRDLTENSIYNGETFDAREARDWHRNNDGFSPVIVTEKPETKLLPRAIPPIRVERYLEYVDAWKSPSGKIILDFGENIAGFIRMKISGDRGRRIVIRHAEEIYKDTRELDFYTNRLAKATDTYILSGCGDEIYEPRFTYHGFRYAEIEGIDEIPEKSAFLAAFMHADLERTLDFECDDAEIMTLYRNAERSMKGNSVSYPTDCTMRDERTPCIMDEVCYAKYGSFFWDTSLYVKEFLRNTVRTGNVNPGWDGAAVTLAAKLYGAFGDKRLIEELYPSLLALVKDCARQWEDGIPDKMFGDWCAPNEEHIADYETGFSNVRESGAALGYLQVAEVLEMAKLIGRNEDIPWLEERLAVIKASYDREFYDAESCTYRGGTVASVLPLCFGMVDEKNYNAVLRSTVERVKNEGHLDTGIYGTRYLPTLFGRNGYLDVALDAMFAKEYPGFGYQFAYGATTLWEQWAEYGNMSSHNHAMFSGACTFIIENLMGIKSYDGAFRRVVIKPDKTKRVTEISSKLHTVRGVYEINYKKTGNETAANITVPFGCEVMLESESGECIRLFSGRHSVTLS